MNKKEIQKKYIGKIKLLNKFNKFYYDKSDPMVSDQEYDILKKEILLLETKHLLDITISVTFLIIGIFGLKEVHTLMESAEGDSPNDNDDDFIDILLGTFYNEKRKN